MPASNNVLPFYCTPISRWDTAALKEVEAVLAPFKNAVLFLCREEACLSHAGKKFRLLFRYVQAIGSEFSDLLLDDFRKKSTSGERFC